MIVVEIYSKPDCHLCDVAKEIVMRVRSSVPFELRMIDVAKDPDLAARYGERIPVIFIGGEFAYQYRVPEDDFRRRLEALGKRD